jgi:hypothetical protein
MTVLCATSTELTIGRVAPRLAFQKIFQAPRGGQLKITGNVVNVPADVNNTVNMLPRLSQQIVHAAFHMQTLHDPLG